MLLFSSLRLPMPPCVSPAHIWLMRGSRGSCGDLRRRRVALPLLREANAGMQRRALIVCHVQLARASPVSSSSSSPSPPPFSSSSPELMQARDVVTRLGPSERLPGLRGVFLTKAVKKFHPIEVLPNAALAAMVPMNAAAHDSPAGQPDAPLGLTPGGVTQAPPLVLNLAFAPRHYISLRRFLALRHMYSTSSYLHVSTEKGWYLVAPSTAAPLCADVAGLQAWCCRHHHRYLYPQAAVAKQGTLSSALSSQATHLSRDTEICKMEAALSSAGELDEEQLKSLATQERTSAGQKPIQDQDRGDDDDDDDIGPAVHEAHHPLSQLAVPPPRNTLGGFSAGVPALASELATPQLKTSPPLITEAHLFEINDGVAWPLPPSDDLANHEYWEGHRHRMMLYESAGDTDAPEQREALLTSLRADPEVMRRLSSEQELHAAAEALFQALKQKANVTLHVDAETGLLTLVPLRDLEAGEELLLHYGREWWTGRLLFSLLLAVPDAEMPQIRWIEQLFHHTVDKNEVFPLLITAHQQRKRPRRGGVGRKGARHSAKNEPDDGEQQRASCAVSAQRACGIGCARSPVAIVAEKPVPRRGLGRLVLYNTVTRKRATDAAVLAFAVRRSCTDQSFFDRLVIGNTARGIAPVFCLSEPDKEVPIGVLRRVLLASLLGVSESPQGEVAHDIKPDASMTGIPITETLTVVPAKDVSSHMNAASVSDDADDTVFSV